MSNIKTIITALILLGYAQGIFATNDNKFKSGHITNSTVIVFQGNKFDLKDKDQFSTFIDAIKKFPTVYKQFETYLNKRFDNIDDRLENIVNLVKKSNSVQELEKNLIEANKQVEALRKEIDKLQFEAKRNPDYHYTRKLQIGLV